MHTPNPDHHSVSLFLLLFPSSLLYFFTSLFYYYLVPIFLIESIWRHCFCFEVTRIVRNSDRQFLFGWLIIDDALSRISWELGMCVCVCVCLCGLDERVRSPRDCVRWRQLAFDDRQYVPHSTARASLFNSISPVAAFDCPFGQLVGRFHSVRSHYANSRPSRSYPSQGETGKGSVFKLLLLMFLSRGPGACVYRYVVIGCHFLGDPCPLSTSCWEGMTLPLSFRWSISGASHLSGNVSSFILFSCPEFLLTVSGSLIDYLNRLNLVYERLWPCWLFVFV